MSDIAIIITISVIGSLILLSCLLCTCCLVMICKKSSSVTNNDIEDIFTINNLSRPKSKTIKNKNKNNDLLNKDLRDEYEIDHEDIIWDQENPVNNIVTDKAFIFSFTQNTKSEDVVKFVNYCLSEEKLPKLVILKVDSLGGEVSEFGAVYSELMRLKRANIKITSCVDRYAASGGYLVACVGDKIYANELAMIGSIGVIAQFPNYKTIFDKIGISYETFVAGDHKMPYDQFNTNSEEVRDFIKLKLQKVHQNFKDIIKRHRPEVDLDLVSNGDIWEGNDALELKLIDKIITSNEYIYNISKYYQIYNFSSKNVKKSFYSKILSKLGYDKIFELKSSIRNFFL